MVELVFSRPGETSIAKALRYALQPEQALENGEYLYVRELTPDQCGKMEYQVRAFPTHPLLTHPFEMGMTIWL
jgi:starch phosphorylase